MKNLLIFLALIPYLFSINTTNPSILLNPQDVPHFYGSNPLTGLEAFTIITSFPLKNEDEQKAILQSIEKTIKEAGVVTHLKDNDVKGFAAGNLLVIQMGQLKASDGSEMPLTRISLSVETPTTLDKTGLKTYPMVWSINTFLPNHPAPENSLIKATQKLLSDFLKSYQYANLGQASKTYLLYL